VDEIDSILIDEARIPLVIAGGGGAPRSWCAKRNALARRLTAGSDYELVDTKPQGGAHRGGCGAYRGAVRCGNLFDPANGRCSSRSRRHCTRRPPDARRRLPVQVRSVTLIDEYKGRVAERRRWPDSLQAAVEAKEGLNCAARRFACWGSIAMQNFIGLYPRLCGMTGTAATQGQEFREMYELEVVVVPTHRPVIRRDLPTVVFKTRTRSTRL